MKRYIRSNSNNSIELSEIQKLYKQIQKLFAEVLMTNYSDIDIRYEFTPFEHTSNYTYDGACKLHFLNFYSSSLDVTFSINDSIKEISVTDQSSHTYRERTIYDDEILALGYYTGSGELNIYFSEPSAESDVNNRMVFHSTDEVKAVTTAELKKYLNECIRCNLIRFENIAADILHDTEPTNDESDQAMQDIDYSIEDLYDIVGDYVNDTDWMYEYDTPRKFGNAVIKHIESEYRKLTKKEKKYVMDQAKLIDFDDYDADNY